MKNKTLTILPILFYSGFASASLYVHQPVERNNVDDSRLKIIYDEEEAQESVAKSEYNKNTEASGKKELVAKADKVGGKEHIVKTNKEGHHKAKEKHHDSLSHKGKGKESSHTVLETPPKDKTPEYKDVVLSSDHKIEPKVKTIYAKMEEGFLSNSMRKHLESLGWEMRWSSGSDRKITVPYVIEHKENDVVEFVTQISELYGVFIDVYPKNKTIHVSD
jgi:hypothetical protein